MNKLINLIKTKKINHTLKKILIEDFIEDFINDYKEQFISGDLDVNCLHRLHYIFWSSISQYYENYIFGPIRIDKVKPKILKQLMKNIERQTHSLHCYDKFEFISNLKSLFRTTSKYNNNCFACYYSCYDNFKLNDNCECCPILKWRIGNCIEYGKLYQLTKNKKDFKLNKQNIINLSKAIRDLEWSN